MFVCSSILYEWDAACMLGVRDNTVGYGKGIYRQGKTGWWGQWRRPEDLQSPQQLQVSADGLARSFLSSFIGSGNSLYNSTSVSWKQTRAEGELHSTSPSFSQEHVSNGADWKVLTGLSCCYLFKGVACNSLEGLLHIDCLLGTGFEIWDVVLALTPSLSSLGCYLKHKGINVILRKFRLFYKSYF